MNEPVEVKVGQVWESVRNGRAVRVVEVKALHGGCGGARVSDFGRSRWLTVRPAGILGYRLVSQPHPTQEP